VHYLLARNITVFTLDFAGCGLSEGEYISLGFYERGDVDCVFQYLRGLGTVSSIGIWGRSMGAATALMYSDTNHEIGCLVLDSPFANLERLSKELAEKHGGGLAIFSGIALSLIKSTIKDKVIPIICSTISILKNWTPSDTLRMLSFLRFSYMEKMTILLRPNIRKTCILRIMVKKN